MESQTDPTPTQPIECSPSMWGRIKLITVIIVILLFGVFLGKNFTPVEIWLFGWDLAVPLVGVALGCFILGVLCGWILNYLYRRRLEEE